MMDALSKLHDATLLDVRFDWKSRICELRFRGAPTIQYPFSLVFDSVSELQISSRQEWGPSVSVLEAEVLGDGRHSFSMQSGDILTVVAPNYVFKPTADSSSLDPTLPPAAA